MISKQAAIKAITTKISQFESGEDYFFTYEGSIRLIDNLFDHNERRRFEESVGESGKVESFSNIPDWSTEDNAQVQTLRSIEQYKHSEHVRRCIFYLKILKEHVELVWDNDEIILVNKSISLKKSLFISKSFSKDDRIINDYVTNIT